MSEDIVTLERRLSDLMSEVDARKRRNQARRAELLLARELRTWPLIVAVLVALAVGTTIGAFWFPRTPYVTVDCR